MAQPRHCGFSSLQECVPRVAGTRTADRPHHRRRGERVRCHRRRVRIDSRITTDSGQRASRRKWMICCSSRALCQVPRRDICDAPDHVDDAPPVSRGLRLRGTSGDVRRCLERQSVHASTDPLGLLPERTSRCRDPAQTLGRIGLSKRRSRRFWEFTRTLRMTFNLSYRGSPSVDLFRKPS